MKISLIVAVAENGAIGRGGQLPWRLSADLQRFKQLTLGHHLLMGRKTFESIGRALPGRTSVIITRQENFELGENCLRAASLEQAVQRAQAAGETEAFVIGGAEIYRAALPLADRVYLTSVHANVAGDVFFSDFDETQWELLASEQCPASEKNEFAHTFRVYERRRG